MLLLGVALIAATPISAADQSTSGKEQDAGERAARIERLETAIEQQRDALSKDRATRRAMRERLEQVRTDLEDTREREQSLEQRIDRGADRGSKGTDTR